MIPDRKQMSRIASAATVSTAGILQVTFSDSVCACVCVWVCSWLYRILPESAGSSNRC